MATYETQIENLIGEDINSSSTDVLQIDVTNWMAEGLQTIVNVLPEDMLWMLEASTKEYSETDAVHGVSVGTNKILYVQRLSDSLLTDSDGDGVADVKTLIECREVPASLRGRVKAGSGWKEESSETDPVWYKLGKRIYVEPAPTDYISSGSEFGAVANLSKASGSTSFEPYGTYSSTGATGYELEVTSALDGVDRFKWSNDKEVSYTSNVAMNSAKQYEFAASAEGWTVADASINTTTDLKVTSTGTSGAVQVYSPGSLSIDGSKNRYIRIRVKTSDNKFNADGGNWYGRLYYQTASAYDKWIQFTPSSTGAYENIILDMHQGLNSGGSDYMSSTITNFKFQPFTTKSLVKECTLTHGSAQITATSAIVSTVQVGDTVTATGIPAGTRTVVSIDDSTHFTISVAVDHGGNVSIAQNVTFTHDSTGDIFEISHFIVGADDDNGVLTVGTISENTSETAWSDAVYSNVTYTAVGNNTTATFDVTVSSGNATVSVKNYGDGYAVNDVITVNDSQLGANGGDNLTFNVASLYRPQGNNLGDGVYIRWEDANSQHAVGDKYEFYAEPSKRSKVYYIAHPSGWKYDSDYLTGAVPKEIDPIVLNYVAARALEQKLANIQNGSSASLEQYIIDEDIDLAQAQQILIQDTHALIDRYTKEYQMGIQGLMTGTYAPQSTGGEKQQPAYSNVAQ